MTKLINILYINKYICVLEKRLVVFMLCRFSSFFAVIVSPAFLTIITAKLLVIIREFAVNLCMSD